MCIVFVAHRVHPKYPLIIASNRDEYLDRPTEPMRVWAEDFDVASESNCSSNGNSDISNHQNGNGRERCRRVSLAGRDLVGGGTWLGVALPIDKKRDEENTDDTNDASVPLRWIAITNFRGGAERHGRPSRGGLLTEYLDGEFPSAHSFVSNLQIGRGQQYNGFNLLLGDSSGIYYYGNQMTDVQSANKPLDSGVYGLSNGLLHSPWPKVERGKELLRILCQRDTEEPSSVESLHEKLMNILRDQVQPASDDQLPSTGIPPKEERYLSSIFLPKGLLAGKEYGTRSSTTIVVDTTGKVSVLERTRYPSESDRWFRFDSKGADRLDGMLVSRTR